MLYYALVFLLVALIAAVLGFGGVAVAFAGIAKGACTSEHRKLPRQTSGNSFGGGARAILAAWPAAASRFQVAIGPPPAHRQGLCRPMRLSMYR